MAIKNYVMSGFFTGNNIVPAVTPTQNALLETRFLKSTLSKEVKSEDIQGIVDGSDYAQILDTISTSITYKFEVDYEAVDSDIIALMFGEQWASAANYDDRLTKMASVPAATPYTIADANIPTTPVAGDIHVTISDNGAWGFRRPLEVILTGSPTGDQVLVTGTTTKTLTFPSTLAGVPVKYSVRKPRTSIDSLGVSTSPAFFNDLKFIGHIASTRKEEIICEVDLTPAGGWQLPVGDKPSVKLEFKPITKGSNRSAVRFYRIAA
ncbi:MAG: hypothetical protein DCF22_00505 [Leptolyngbya sp.]|nr:MAG: hypothetical protein DCF22_00505 [Leptolyngbya sp.]